MKTAQLAKVITDRLQQPLADAEAVAAAATNIKSEADRFEAARDAAEPHKAVTQVTWDVVLCKVGDALRRPHAVTVLRHAHPGLAAAVPRAWVAAQAGSRLHDHGADTVWCAVAGARFPMSIGRLNAWPGSYLATLLGNAAPGKGDDMPFATPRRSSAGDIVIDGLTQEQFSYLHQFIHEECICRLGKHNWHEVRDVAVRFGPQEMIDYVDATVTGACFPASMPLPGAERAARRRDVIKQHEAWVESLLKDHRKALLEAWRFRNGEATPLSAIASATGARLAEQRGEAIEQSLQMAYSMLHRLHKQQRDEDKTQHVANFASLCPSVEIAELAEQVAVTNIDADRMAVRRNIETLRFQVEEAEARIVTLEQARQAAHAQARTHLMRPSGQNIATIYAGATVAHAEDIKQQVQKCNRAMAQITKAERVLSAGAEVKLGTDMVAHLSDLVETMREDQYEARALLAATPLSPHLLPPEAFDELEHYAEVMETMTRVLHEALEQAR